MLGIELAARASRWSRIRESSEGREGGGRVDSRFRRDSSGDCEVDDEAIGKSEYQTRTKAELTWMREIGEDLIFMDRFSKFLTQFRVKNIFRPKTNESHSPFFRNNPHILRTVLCPIHNSAKFNINHRPPFPDRFFGSSLLFYRFGVFLSHVV